MIDWEANYNRVSEHLQHCVQEKAHLREALTSLTEMMEAAMAEEKRLTNERDQARTEANHADELVERMRLVLEEIVNPVAAMRSRVPPGYRFDGRMACRLAEMPSHLQEIARKGLEEIRYKQNRS